MSEHTPTPWHMESHDREDDRFQEHSVIEATTYGLCVMVYGGSDKERIADAEFILRAANYHDALVETLHGGIGAQPHAMDSNLDILADTVLNASFGMMSRETVAAILHQYATVIRAALAQVEGETAQDAL